MDYGVMIGVIPGRLGCISKYIIMRGPTGKAGMKGIKIDAGSTLSFAGILVGASNEKRVGAKE